MKFSANVHHPLSARLVGQTSVCPPALAGVPLPGNPRARQLFRNSLPQTLLCAFLLSTPALAVERAAYDVNGRLTALLSNAEDVPVATNVVAILPTGKRISLQRRTEARRSGDALTWSLSFELPDGGHGTIDLKSVEDASGVHYTTALAAESTLEIDAIEVVVDLPRAAFVKGSVTPDNAPPVTLAVSKPGSPVMFRGDAKTLHFTGSTGILTIDATFDQPHTVSVVDRWDTTGRSYQLRTVLMKGPVYSGAKASLTTTLLLASNPPAPPPVHLTLDTSRPRYSFDGFGGNYCWDTKSPIADYTMQNLKVSWARSEMKLLQWDKHRDSPPPDVRGDLERNDAALPATAHSIRHQHLVAPRALLHRRVRTTQVRPQPTDQA